MTLLELLQGLDRVDARLAIEEGDLCVYARVDTATAADLGAAISLWLEAVYALALGGANPVAAARARLFGRDTPLLRVRALWGAEGVEHVAAVLEGRYSSDQAADRELHAATRERATSTRIGSRQGGAEFGRAPSRGGRSSDPRGWGRS